MLLPLGASHGCLAVYVGIRVNRVTETAERTGLLIIVLSCLCTGVSGRLQAFKTCLPVWFSVQYAKDAHRGLQSVFLIIQLETGRDDFLKTDQDAVLLAC